MAVKWGAAIKKPTASSDGPSSTPAARVEPAQAASVPIPTLSPVVFASQTSPQVHAAHDGKEIPNAKQDVPKEAKRDAAGATTRPGALSIVAEAQRERLRREQERLTAAEKKEREDTARKIQRWYTSHRLRKRELESLRRQWDDASAEMGASAAPSTPQGATAAILRTLRSAQLLLIFYDPAKDSERLAKMAQVLADGTPSVRTSITTLLLNRSYVAGVINVLKRICRLCYIQLGNSSPKSSTVGSCLRFVLLFLDAKTYKLPNVGTAGSNAAVEMKARDDVLSFLFSGPNGGGNVTEFYACLGATLNQQVPLAVSTKTATKGQGPEAAENHSVFVSALLLIVSLVASWLQSRQGSPADGEAASHLLEFTINILGGVPLVIFLSSGESVAKLQQTQLLERVVALLTSKDSEKLREGVLSRLGPDGLLVLLENIVTLYRRTRSAGFPSHADASTTDSLQHPDLLRCLTAIVQSAESFVLVSTKQSTRSAQTTTFHHLLGFVSTATALSIPGSAGTNAAFRRVLQQISWIWSATALRAGFGKLLGARSPITPAGSGIGSNLALLAIDVKDCCEFYIQLAGLLKPHRTEIYQSLAFSIPELLPCLWTFMKMVSRGPESWAQSSRTAVQSLTTAVQNLKTSAAAKLSSKSDRISESGSGEPPAAKAGAPTGIQMDVFISAVRAGDPKREPLVWILELFCEGTVLLLLTSDDEEVYVKQRPFSLAELADISLFLNSLLFRIYFSNLDSVPKHAQLIDIAKRLLGLLHDRNDRRAFLREEDWIIKETAMIEAFDPKRLESGLKGGVNRILASAAQLFRPESADGLTAAARSGAGPLPSPTTVLDNLPQTVPFHVRVALLRDTIRAEKNSVSTASFAPVKIRRRSVLEDGFQHLGRLSPFQLKQRVTIKFVNEFGMDEIGIDQSGVFKEFLEQLCKRAFSPDAGLFRSIPGTETIVPNPLSGMVHENHLQLFEFLGRILGKALYEGIVIDVPFGLFFYAKVLNRFNTFDDLPSLDPDLYKQLTFVKHYDGDVADLGLTFSFDEEVFGKYETREIKPGGVAIDVTNDNKFAYIYLLSDFHLNRKARDQTLAFIKGFKSLIPDSWLRFFSPLELQRLLSGEGTDFDVAELRACAAYEGGYSDAHPTIRALWEVVDSYDSEDRKRFLRFVTSCSRPPVGGFGYLNPKFTIRYLPDDGAGDAAPVNPLKVVGTYFGSVIGGKDIGRLPTSATCFNRLLLPAFKKKSTLKDRLTFAIRSGAGFELS
ncbi:hypothetical protein DFJ74DRAFT_668881 [Hyaloraphidium curvatum]|nr:hypothetical protein DFJ74DRAFT_668881 [Hyaloraphidium curvatum]